MSAFYQTWRDGIFPPQGNINGLLLGYERMTIIAVIWIFYTIMSFVLLDSGLLIYAILTGSSGSTLVITIPWLLGKFKK